MLNESERQRLAEIDAHLRKTDPDLVQVLTRPSCPPQPGRPAVRLSIAALIAAPWLALLEGWPLVIAAVLVLATLVSSVWVQTGPKRPE